MFSQRFQIADSANEPYISNLSVFSQRFQIADSANEPYIIIETGLCVQIREIVHTPAVVIQNVKSTNRKLFGRRGFRVWSVRVFTPSSLFQPGGKNWRENLDWFTGQIERTITDISRLRRRDKYYFWHLYHS